jgi:hypothetical protein
MADEPTLGWRVRHSWWLLLSILGFGCLNGLGFIYIGLRARRPAWWIPGIVYLVAGWAFFLLGSSATPETAAATWFAMSWFAVWVGSLLHACLVNSAWLRWRAGYRPWHARPPATSYGDARVPATGLPPGLAPPPGHYYGPPQGPPLEVNTAGPEQFATLPGFDPERIRRVLAERQARRGFGSVEEFAAAASLAPHEFVRVRELVVCVPHPPAQPEPPTRGRILDV